MSADLFVTMFNGNCTEKKASLSMKDGEGKTLKLTIDGEVKDDSEETILAAVRGGVKVALSRKLSATKTFGRSGSASGAGAENLAKFILTDGLVAKTTGGAVDPRGIDAALDAAGIPAAETEKKKSRNGAAAS